MTKLKISNCDKTITQAVTLVIVTEVTVLVVTVVIGEISSKLYRAPVCDMKKGLFFANKFIPNFVLHTLNYLVWDDKEYIRQAPRPFMTPDKHIYF